MKLGQKEPAFYAEEIFQYYGLSRQAHHQWLQAEDHRLLEEEIILQYVRQVRQRLPKLGGRKLHYLLGKKWDEFGFSLGRDHLFDLLRQQGLLVERIKKRVSTTHSKHRFYIYDNLFKNLVDISKNQVIVADITYLETREGFGYLALITEVYSRKIMGYDFCGSLSIEGSLRALTMALDQTQSPQGMIHHSDRGIQYCSKAYIQLLTDHHCQISMAEKGNPYENALAERINGILKEEFLLNQGFRSLLEARKAVIEAIHLYNEERPHSRIGMLTPHQKYALEETPLRGAPPGGYGSTRVAHALAS